MNCVENIGVMEYGKKDNIMQLKRLKLADWICQRYPEAGERWLNNINNIVSKLSMKWGLRNIEILSDSQYNFTAFCRYNKTQEAFLKIAYPEVGILKEYSALKDLNSKSVITPLQYSKEDHAILFPRLKPGNKLLSLKDNVKETRIAASLMKGMSKNSKISAEYSHLDDWFKRLEYFKLNQHLINIETIERAQSIYKELREEHKETILLHGDLHHYNILGNEEAWMIIDPKGVIGIPLYETSCFLYNPESFLTDDSVKNKLLERIEIFSNILGYHKMEIALMGYCQSVLSACWCIEDKMNCWKSGIKWSEIFKTIITEEKL